MAKLSIDSRIAVVGAGTMGHGIAQVFAMAGFETRLCDEDPRALELARLKIERNLHEGVRREKIDKETRSRAVASLTCGEDLEAAARGARLVVEAVPEDLSLKQRILEEAAAVADEKAIFATNTSSLSITSLAEPFSSPERVVGMHFFNPVHIMELVEIVRGEKTEASVVTIVANVARKVDKTPIVVKDSPGFATSRLGVAMGLEAIRMLEAGVASAADIDKAMTLGYRHPMGPLRLTDLVGLDVRLGIAEYLAETIDQDRFAPPALLQRLVKQGKLGKKTGEGFYKWKKRR